MARSIGMLAGAKAGDLVLIVAGQGGVPAKEPGSVGRVKPALDALRRTLAAKLELADPNTLAFLWVVDFPLFEWNDEEERWDPTHHLFTAAKPEDMALLETRPGQGAQQRLRPRLQRLGDRRRQHPDPQPRRAGADLRAAEHHARSRRASASGTCWTPSSSARRRTAASPWASTARPRMFAQDDDIREMIAFPKTKSASDLMTGAPVARGAVGAGRAAHQGRLRTTVYRT